MALTATGGGGHSVVRVGMASADEMLAYLHAHHREAIFALHDLVHRGEPGVAEPSRVIGYRTDDGILGVQCFYSSGRWLPHLADPAVVAPMLEDAVRHPLRWVVGARRVLDPLVEALLARGYFPAYDQVEVLCSLDADTFRPFAADVTARRATRADVHHLADLRRRFEAEYFPGGGQGQADWYENAAEQAVRDGAYLVEAGGVAAATVSVEADIPELTHIGAVYTRAAYRGRGLAKAVVSAICREALGRRRRVTLTVRWDNAPARRAYEALGFQPWDEYRMCRLARSAPSSFGRTIRIIPQGR